MEHDLDRHSKLPESGLTNSPWEATLLRAVRHAPPVRRGPRRRASPFRSQRRSASRFAYHNDACAWVQDEEDPFDINEDADNEWLRIDVLESDANPGIARPPTTSSRQGSTRSPRASVHAGLAERDPIPCRPRGRHARVPRRDREHDLVHARVARRRERIQRQACRLLLGARQHDPERDRDPGRNVPRPRREPAGNGCALQGCDARRSTTRARASAATTSPATRRPARWSATAATATPAATRTWPRTNELDPARTNGAPIP